MQMMPVDLIFSDVPLILSLIELTCLSIEGQSHMNTIGVSYCENEWTVPSELQVLVYFVILCKIHENNRVKVRLVFYLLNYTACHALIFFLDTPVCL